MTEDGICLQTNHSIIVKRVPAAVQNLPSHGRVVAATRARCAMTSFAFRARGSLAACSGASRTISAGIKFCMYHNIESWIVTEVVIISSPIVITSAASPERVRGFKCGHGLNRGIGASITRIEDEVTCACSPGHLCGTEQEIALHGLAPGR